MSATAVQGWLQAFCDRSASVAGGVVLMDSGDGTLQTAAEWPTAGPASQPLIAAARVAAKRAEPLTLVPAVTARDAGYSRVISLPLKSDDRALGAVALGVRASDEKAASGLLRELERASGTLASALAAATIPARNAHATHALQLQNLLLGSPRLAEAAAALVNEMASTLKFDRVSLGMVERGHVNVLALSHNGEFKGPQELVRAFAAAMQEAIDQACSVRYPADSDEAPRIVLAHAELAARTGNRLCTVPLMSAGQVVGAICFERAGGVPTSDEVNRYEHLGCLLGPLLALRQRVEQPGSTRAAEALRAGWTRLARRDDPWPKVVLAVIACALAAATLVPLPYRVGAPARLEGAVQRVVAAPTDGFLRATHVRPGDVVKTGDLLVELADQDLLLEQRKWESALAQHENTFSAALARSDRAQFVINQAKANEARAQLELVRGQLERTRLTAPIDGIVIKGDLTQSLGAPVQRGDPLLTLAPEDSYRLIVEIDERDVADVRPGQRGHLALSAMPVDTLGFTVERVTPVAVSKDGRNAFEVQASLETGVALLRPGLQGVAKIDIGSRTAAWLFTHRIADWLRLAFWNWGT